MPSHIELRLPQWTGRPAIQVEMRREVVQDLAMATGEDWLAGLIGAVRAEQPAGTRRFLAALEQAQEQAMVVFHLAADEHCAAAEVVRYLSESQKRRA
ncbi:hypothetical protein [Desertibaculum subflavum]|uniref:hypothetical protein n=1 Tax=Desertibaculum subflavum TaxID=2268458 RepID=UPI000E6677EC